MASTCKYTVVYSSSTHGHIEGFYLQPYFFSSALPVNSPGHRPSSTHVLLLKEDWVWGHGDSVFPQFYPSAPFSTIGFILGDFLSWDGSRKCPWVVFWWFPCEPHRRQWEGMILWKAQMLWPGRDNVRMCGPLLSDLSKSLSLWKPWWVSRLRSLCWCFALIHMSF